MTSKSSILRNEKKSVKLYVICQNRRKSLKKTKKKSPLNLLVSSVSSMIQLYFPCVKTLSLIINLAAFSIFSSETLSFFSYGLRTQ